MNTDTERLDWIMERLNIISRMASGKILASLAIDDGEWRGERNERKIKAAFRAAIDRAMSE